MHPFSTGDVVLCVDDTPLSGRHPKTGHWIKAGRAYRVAAATCNLLPGGAIEYGIELIEVPHVPPSRGWFAWRFRKIERADEEFGRSLVHLREKILLPTS